MQEYLRDKPAENFPVPENIVFAKVGRRTDGEAPSEGGREAFAAFVEGTQPSARRETPASGEETGGSGTETTSGSFFKSDLFWGGN